MGERGNMLRLLALVATTLAAPQYLSPYGGYLYPQYTGYPMGLYGYPNYSPVRMAYPTTQYIPMVQAMNQPQSPNTLQLVKFENFMEINGNFATSTTQASLVVVGTINLSQNLVTDFLNGNEAQYKIYVQSSSTTDLTGKNIRLGLASSCTTAATDTSATATAAAPSELNGFYIAGRTTGYNINGENSKVSLKGKFMQ